jgi:hypothetical protein
MEEWRYRSTILNLGARWRWVVIFTPASLYRKGKSPRYPLDRWAPEPVWTVWRRENLDPVGNRTRIVHSVDRRYTDWAVPTGWVGHIMFLNDVTVWWLETGWLCGKYGLRVPPASGSFLQLPVPCLSALIALLSLAPITADLSGSVCINRCTTRVPLLHYIN